MAATTAATIMATTATIVATTATIVATTATIRVTAATTTAATVATTIAATAVMTTAATVVVVAMARRAASLQTGQWYCRLRTSLAFSPLGAKNPASSSRSQSHAAWNRGRSRVVMSHGGSSHATSHATSRAASRSHARSRAAIRRANHQSRVMSLRYGVASPERSD